jgi:hypothetical protein
MGGTQVVDSSLISMVVTTVAKKGLDGWGNDELLNRPGAHPMEDDEATWCCPNLGSWHVLCPYDGNDHESNSIPWDWVGCTYLCQPVDVSLNKSIKCGMWEKWEDRMLEGDGIVNGVAKEPSWKQVAEWLLDVYNNIPRETGRNAGWKKGYEWFWSDN